MEDGRIPDSRISASTTHRADCAPSLARLDFQGGEGKKGGWLSKYDDYEAWIQVDLEKTMMVSQIQTQGHDFYSQWIKKFNVSYSYNGKSYEDYKDLDGQPKVRCLFYYRVHP